MDVLKCDMIKMRFDEACLHLQNFAQYPVDISYQSTECFKCNLQPLLTVASGTIKKQIVKTTYGSILQFSLFNYSLRTNTYYFEQHGHYRINFTNQNVSDLYEISPASDAYKPLYALLWTIIVGWILWSIGSFAITYTRFCQPRLLIHEAENDLGAISRSGVSTPLLSDTSREICTTGRIQSIDVFRGITITLMLFVNYGGGKYRIFEHSPWNGLTIADVIYPWFAWIMGTSLILSINSHLRNSMTKSKLFSKVFLRSLALCAVGIILNSYKNNDILNLRLPGVLQRLSLAYLIVGCLEVAFTPTRSRYNITGNWIFVEDWIYGWAQWLIILSLVGIYCIFMFFMSVPGCPNGYLGPGGLHENGTFKNCTAGAAGYIDRYIFTNHHLYNGTLVNSIYQNQLPFDPEGLLGTLTTALTTFMGVYAGRIIFCFTNPKGRILRWLIMAIITSGVAGELSGWSKELGAIPINKNLWSISFALVTSSLAFYVYSLLFYLIDYKEWWTGKPFYQVGRNAIFIYVGSILTKEMIPWNWTPIDYTTNTQILLMNFWSTCLWILIAILLDAAHIWFNI